MALLKLMASKTERSLSRASKTSRNLPDRFDSSLVSRFFSQQNNNQNVIRRAVQIQLPVSYSVTYLLEQKKVVVLYKLQLLVRVAQNDAYQFAFVCSYSNHEKKNKSLVKQREQLMD